MISFEEIYKRFKSTCKKNNALKLLTLSTSNFRNYYYNYSTLFGISEVDMHTLYEVTLSSNYDEGIIIFCEIFRDKLSYDDLTKISHDYINKYLKTPNIPIIICLEYLYRYFYFNKSKYELMEIFQ